MRNISPNKSISLFQPNKFLLTAFKATFAVFLLSSMVNGQAPLFTENFSFTGKLTVNGYTAHSSPGVNPINTGNGLSFVGYEGSSIGNAARIGNATGEDVNRTFSSQSTNGQSVFFSLLVNVNETATSKTGDIFFHTGSGGGANWTAFSGRIAARVVNGNVHFGITNSSTITYGATNFSRNTTYLLVLKYTIATGASNDPLSLWVIRSGIPATEIAAGTAEVRNNTTAGTDAVNAVGLRQGAKNISPSVIVDGIRVGTTWSAVLPPSLTPAVSTNTVTFITGSSATAGGNITAAGVTSVTRRGVVYSTSAITDTNSISGGGKIIDASGGTGSYTANLIGLSVNTTYQVRAFAVNAAGVGYGSSVSFTTRAATPLPPVVSNPTSTSLNVDIASGDGNPSSVTYAIQDSITGKYVGSTGSLVDTAVYRTDAQWGTTTVGNLFSSSFYYFRAIARNSQNNTVAGLSTPGTTLASCGSAYDTPWNNDYQGTSYFPGPMSIPFNTDVSGRIEASNDRDYYKFFVTTGGTITMTLTNLPADYQLNLVNSLGNSIATSTNTGTASESINATVTSNTVYYAFVYSPNLTTFNANSCYTLRVSTGTASRPVLATPGVARLYPNPANGFVNLQLPERRGVMQIRVLNSMGATVIRQNTNQSLTNLKLQGLAPGIYWVEVLNGDGRLAYRSKLLKQ